MSEEPESKYRQLGLFGVIVSEVVVTPCVLGGGVYWLMRERPGQNLAAGVAAVLGLLIGFYRVSKMGRKNEDEK